MNRSNPFKLPHYEPEIILLCIRWYLRYPLSYHNLEEMAQERRLNVDHATLFIAGFRDTQQLELGPRSGA